MQKLPLLKGVSRGANIKIKKGEYMKKAEEKQKYEPALLELVKFGAFDIITTSVFEENVDPDGWT